MGLQRLSSKLVKYKDTTVYKHLESIDHKLSLDNYETISASDFGLKVGTQDDNQDALYELGVFLSTTTKPTRVTFPKGVSYVGSQEFANGTGKGFSYRPAYFNRDWGDLGSAGWFSVNTTDTKIILDMEGWTLKLSDGMRFGAFDPVTGEKAQIAASESPNTDYLASTGYLIKLYKAPNVVILGGTTDHNLSNLVWGGEYGNAGYQVPAYNMWINQSAGAYVRGHRFLNSPVDGLYHQSTGYYSFLDIVEPSIIEDCYWENHGRNAYSLTGSANIIIVRPIIHKTGALATGVPQGFGGHPGAGIDIEAEGGNPYYIRIIDPKIVNVEKAAIMFVSTPGEVNDVLVSGGVLHSWHSDGVISNHGRSRNLKFEDVTIIGSIVDAGATIGLDAFTFERCNISNRYGTQHCNDFLLSFKVFKFNDNTITISIPESGISKPTISMSDQDGLPFGVIERFKGNRLIVYGDASKVTFVNGLGGINNFKNAELYVVADGLTGGTLKLLCDTTSASKDGLCTNSSNFNFGTSMWKDEGKNVWYPDKACRIASVLTPAKDTAIDVGSKFGRFRTGYFDNGIILRDLTNQAMHYRLMVSDGVINIVQDNN